MIALGVLDNQPANSYQPAMIDGIYVRWGFLRELGFPWHGFYLFRRPARPGNLLCLSSVIGGLNKGNWPENKHYTAIGLLSSTANLVLTDDFAPANQVEFAFDGCNYLRFDFPASELARRIELRIGLRAERCWDFQKLIPPPQPPLLEVALQNPLILQGVTFAVKGSDGQLAPKTLFGLLNTLAGPLMGLKCGYGLTITLPAPTNSVDLLMTCNVITATIAAFDKDDVVVDSTTLTNPMGGNQPETIQLNGQDIIRVEVHTLRDAAYLHRIRFDSLSVEGQAEVRVTAFSGTTPVRSLTISGTVGQVASATIEADAISAVEIGPGGGSLIDLCYVPVTQEATQGWERLPQFSYPMGLPVSQPDYPCSVANPELLLVDRVHYPLPPGWNEDGSTFIELHDQLVKLVQGGPGAAPMVDRIFAATADVSNPPDLDPPSLSTFYILDMVLLGALHPALAQLVGLYWVDQSALPGAGLPALPYDYLIVADHTGAGQRDADRVLSLIKSSGFAQLDGYIVFNKRAAAEPPLPAPDGLQTFALPGGTFPDAQGQLPPACNNAGLRWEVGWDADSLLPGSAVMYLVWRADLGDGATPAPGGTYNLITKDPPDKPKPVLVTEATIPNGVVPQPPLDWPPDPPHFIDRNLPDGWYGYQVSGIDLFGVYSPNSLAAQLRLQDTIPPPKPVGVEAYAQDPADPFLQQDDAYNNWRASLDSSVQQTLVGLRVRWIWTLAHQRQAPDTHEFRIYFHPGAALPPDHDQPMNWQERYYVVGYDDNVEIDSVSGDRSYEIFLPPPTAPNPTSIPLNPSLAEPVAYAHVGVSAADDKTHTSDQRTTGNWSNRFGNEGGVLSSKIYRVLRTPPLAPEGVLNGERYYASPADYHNRSFFTYRWKPEESLKLHVFRAMDDGVFKADWATRPSEPILDESQLEFFPAEWNQATRQQVADELNHLNSFVDPENRAGQAMAYYRQLSDAALRVLPGLPSSESAFVQMTINPLAPDDIANANRLGPDDPDDLIPDPSQRAFIDTLDGRSTNRYFYRSASIDAAHNLGALGLSSPPVYLPNVVPPRAPVITKVLGGDRQITLKWASNREPDLAEYRVYRTDNEEATRDLRLMTLVHTEPVPPGDPIVGTAEASWTETPVAGLVTFYYRLVAVDDAQNVSQPSRIVTARATDSTPPGPAALQSAQWIKIDASGNELPWTDTTPGLIPAVRLQWIGENPSFEYMAQRRTSAIDFWRTVMPWTSTQVYRDTSVDEVEDYEYRVMTQKPNGQSSTSTVLAAIGK